ncbi:hypothetical protein [Neptunicella marina]|uniref:Uncharacterized protein n=1 Tax=Neptunicella marina TaxID=2125989 RepID=A0A8J6IXF0_9ALTE|nr:hypothetical protein [Neptunicella marina]MBC3767265.1 hypothetical protein [Neptunicella marina]
MNRTDRGFGLFGVVFAVVLLVLSAVFGAKADAQSFTELSVSQSEAIQ